MSIFRLNKCCCIFELTTGGIILGWINIVMSIVIFVISCVILSDVDKIRMEGSPLNPAGLKCIFGIILFIVSMLIISDALLIMGSMHKRASYIVPWLFNESIFLLMSFIIIFLCPDFSSIMASVAYFIFRLYLWLCVYSLHATLKEWPSASADDNGFTYSRKMFLPTTEYADI